METTVKNILVPGKKFSIMSDNKEVARAYLYILSNDLHKEPFGLLEDVFVEESLRGKGVGTELVKSVILAARDAGCYKLIATSRFSRDRVHVLYKSLGFEDYGKEFRINL